MKENIKIIQQYIGVWKGFSDFVYHLDAKFPMKKEWGGIHDKWNSSENAGAMVNRAFNSKEFR